MGEGTWLGDGISRGDSRKIRKIGRGEQDREKVTGEKKDSKTRKVRCTG